MCCLVWEEWTLKRDYSVPSDYSFFPSPFPFYFLDLLS